MKNRPVLPAPNGFKIYPQGYTCTRLLYHPAGHPSIQNIWSGVISILNFRRMVMWIEETKNGKYKFVERYEDYLTGITNKVSVTIERNTPESRKTAQ